MPDDFLIDSVRERELARRFGSELARRREAAGMTQEEAAYRMRIGNQAVSRLERGAVMPSFKRVFEFAGLFECRVDKLVLAASDRQADQAVVFSEIMAGLDSEDRDEIMAIVRQLAKLAAKKRPRPR